MSDLDTNDSLKGRDNFIVSTALWLISSSWGRHLRHRVNPWFSSILGPFWFTELLSIILKWFTLFCFSPQPPPVLAVPYFTGISSCSVLLLLLHLAYHPTHGPGPNQWHTDAVAAMGTESRVLQNISLIVGTEQKAHAHQRSTPFAGCLLQNRRNTRREEIITRDWRIGFQSYWRSRRATFSRRS